MKLGIIKNIMNENKILCIKIHSNISAHPFQVVSAEFDSRTRHLLYLNASIKQNARENNTQTIKSYILDFKDTHEVLVKNLDKNTVYVLQNSFDVDKSNSVLNLYTVDM